MTRAVRESGDVVDDDVELVKSHDAYDGYRPHPPLILCAGTRIGWVQVPGRCRPPVRGLTPPKRLSTPRLTGQCPMPSQCGVRPAQNAVNKVGPMSKSRRVTGMARAVSRESRSESRLRARAALLRSVLATRWR